MNKEIISVDFDGTLVTDEYPSIGVVNLELVNWINDHREDYIFILNTLRKGTYLQQAISFLKDVCDLEFDYVNENVPELVEKYGDSRKIAAHYYIDDHNLTLDNWKEVLDGREKLQNNP